MSYELIQTRTESNERIGVITLNRPQQLNALNDQLMDELGLALKAFDADDKVGCIILTGSERAFAAGADIAAMQKLSFVDAYKGNFITRNWETIRSIRKPVIAAVSGFALGGGGAGALLGHSILAANHPKCAPPKNTGVTPPGPGAPPRRPRAVGKAKAMDMILTGRMMDAQEAERAGLVSRVVPVQDLMGEALKTAEAICSFGQVAVMAAKECVNRAFESALSDGVMHERRLFNALFATADQKEGMDAFLNKRPAQFANR